VSPLVRPADQSRQWAEIEQSAGKDARLRQAFEPASRDAINQVVLTAESCRQPVGQSAEPYYQQAFPIPKRDIAKAKALLKERA